MALADCVAWVGACRSRCSCALDDPGRFLAALDLELGWGTYGFQESLEAQMLSLCFINKGVGLPEYSEITFEQPIKVPHRHVSSSWVQPALVRRGWMKTAECAKGLSVC